MLLTVRTICCKCRILWIQIKVLQQHSLSKEKKPRRSNVLSTPHDNPLMVCNAKVAAILILFSYTQLLNSEFYITHVMMLSAADLHYHQHGLAQQICFLIGFWLVFYVVNIWIFPLHMYCDHCHYGGRQTYNHLLVTDNVLSLSWQGQTVLAMEESPPSLTPCRENFTLFCEYEISKVNSAQN